jgi:hypothetical protein
MTFFRTIRWFRAYLLAFFVAAQVGGVAPLLYDHTLNLTETTPIPSHAHKQVSNTFTAPDADHHHGALDLHDQCCALHTSLRPRRRAGSFGGGPCSSGSAKPACRWRSRPLRAAA